MKLKLQPELVPNTAWCKNLRSDLPKSQWDKLRRAAYAKAGHKCEICGGVGKRHPVECHEVWEYDDEKGIQKLKKVEAICPACHEVKHIGLAGVRGRHNQAIAHMCKVNKIDTAKADKIVLGAMQQWSMRSERQWECDKTLLDKILEELS